MSTARLSFGPQRCSTNLRPFAPITCKSAAFLRTPRFARQFFLAFCEQRHHRVAAADTRERLREQAGAGERADLRARAGFCAQRNRVGDDQFVQSRSGDALARATRQNRVRGVSEDLLRAAFLQHLRCLAERAGGVDHIVHDHAGAAFDFTDDVHHFGDVRLRTTLVDDREIAAELLGERTGAHHAADVRRNDQQVLVVLLAQIAEQHGRSVDVVDGNIEKALNLVSVQIHRDDPLDARDFQHVRHDLRRDGDARRTGAAVLTGITEVGDGCGDPACGCALERIDHDHQFHQVVVGRRAGRLKDEDVLATHVFLDFDLDFAVGEAANHSLTEGNTEDLDDFLCKRGICVASKNHQAVMAAHHAPAADFGGREELLGRTALEFLAGEEGLEPSHAGIKIRCLDQLGDSPTLNFKPD
ncbi:hypothetical protein PSP6_250092 [Paraburkholderia tropica]|nr:hypothetical protein PSP6_250092 [Paraburkholderia tropica]